MRVSYCFYHRFSFWSQSLSHVFGQIWHWRAAAATLTRLARSQRRNRKEAAASCWQEKAQREESLPVPVQCPWCQFNAPGVCNGTGAGCQKFLLSMLRVSKCFLYPNEPNWTKCVLCHCRTSAAMLRDTASGISNNNVLKHARWQMAKSSTIGQDTMPSPNVDAWSFYATHGETKSDRSGRGFWWQAQDYKTSD